MQIRIAAVLGVLFAVSGCRTIEPEPPPNAPRIGSFTASKTLISSGEEVSLSFTTTGATLVELTDDSGHSVQLEGTPESGGAKVSPAKSAFYVLRATGAGGRDTAFVQISVNEPLRDVFLIAVPAVINSGAEGQLLWGAAGASSVTLKTGAGTPMTLTGTTGAISVTPSTTEQYTLTAQGAPGTPPLTAFAEIQVLPVLRTATLASPNGVIAGETLTFSWTTAGADHVTVSEQTLGQLVSVTEPSSVANGTFDYVLPTALPNGVSVTNGLPLHFTVSAVAGGTTISKELVVVVGDLPLIEQFTAPEFVSVGRRFTVSWKTLNASKITILAGGLPVFETVPGSQARVDQGSVDLAAPNAQTEFVLVASDDRGSQARKVFNVSPVALPSITSYTLTSALNALGDPATARWTTTNATNLQLRFENGPTLALITTPSQVASGNVVLTPATGGRVTLEAYNAAGDVVSETRSFTTAATAVTVSPTPALKGASATLNWTLAGAGVLEVVGLGTPAAAPISNSANFVDLATSATATELVMPDTTNGSAKLNAPQNFRFPLLGTVRPNLFVSINGFIAFSAPAALSSNLQLSDTGTPTMLAPLWDDLSMTPTSKILYELKTSVSGERFLVVQWEKLALASDLTSELTFQAHLYETGQVAFLYKTLTGSLASVTVGVKDSAFPLTQQQNYNSMTGVPVAGLELNYFTGGPADGSVTFTANTAGRIEFFGRTATGGLVPASAAVRVFAAGDVSITEVMVLPEVGVSATGQWIELHNNNKDASVDFSGLEVSSTGSTDGGYVIANGLVAPNGYLVIGQSLNPLENGGAPVVEVATDVPLTIPDTVRVSIGGTSIASLSWDAGIPPSGTSLQVLSGALTSGSAFCTSGTSTFGPGGASFGTPGAPNDNCAPYILEPIDAGFIDISGTGTVLLASASSYDGTGSVTLNTPFTYYGQTFNSVNVAMVGFLSFAPSLATGDYVPNDVTPSSTQPNGVVAPFWDQIVRNTNGAIRVRQDPARTIFSWDDFRIYATTSSAYFQVHLLPNGVIEFHYGDMDSSSSTTIASLRGNSATAWIERPDGVVAVPLSVNTPNGIQPRTSFRFTPVP